jgi:hypothetical protein
MITIPSLNLCTFANSIYSKASHELLRSASFSGYFSGSRYYNDRSLGSSFVSKHRRLLRLSTRGYGYWIWKPYVCLQYAASLPVGSYFIYLDAGFRVNPGAWHVLDSYISSLDSAGAILSFNTSENAFHSRLLPPGFRRHEWNNEMFTKSSLMAYLGLLGNRHYLSSQMFQSGIIIARINSAFTDFLREWLRLCELDISFIDDSVSGVWDSTVYRRNENDQAVYSALLFKYGNKSVFSYYDIWPSGVDSKPDWNDLTDSPFHAMRHRSSYLHHRVMRKLVSVTTAVKNVVSY